MSGATGTIQDYRYYVVVVIYSWLYRQFLSTAYFSFATLDRRRER